MAHARQRTAGHVADGVPTRFLRGDADRCQPPHQVGRVVNMHVMKLEVLPRCDVQDSVGILVGKLRQHFHLDWRHAAERDFDALHPRRVPQGVRAFDEVAGRVIQRLRRRAVETLPVVVALPVNAPAQAAFGEYSLVQLVLAAQFKLPGEHVDFAGALIGNLVPQNVFPVVHILASSSDRVARESRIRTKKPVPGDWLSVMQTERPMPMPPGKTRALSVCDNTSRSNTWESRFQTASYWKSYHIGQGMSTKCSRW